MKKRPLLTLLLAVLALFGAMACGVQEGDGEEPRVNPPPVQPPPVQPPPQATMPAPFTFWEACDDTACSASIGVADTYANNAAGIEFRFHRDPKFPETDTVEGPGPNLGGSLFITKKENGRNIATWMCDDLNDGPHRLTYLSSQSDTEPDNLAWAGFGTPEFMDKMSEVALEAIYCTYLDPDADLSVTGQRCDGLPVAVHYVNSNGQHACRFEPAGNAHTGFGQ